MGRAHCGLDGVRRLPTKEKKETQPKSNFIVGKGGGFAATDFEHTTLSYEGNPNLWYHDLRPVSLSELHMKRS